MLAVHGRCALRDDEAAAELVGAGSRRDGRRLGEGACGLAGARIEQNKAVGAGSQGGGFWNWYVFGGPGPLWTKLLTVIMLPMSVIFFISGLAETNRPPFDLPEAESELVAGYAVEYSSTPYLLFMIGEYANIVLMCAMITILFFGGWEFPVPLPLAHDGLPYILISLLTFIVKVVFWFVMFAIAKAIVPRYRYDQLMRLGWKVFLPLSLVAVVLVAGYRVYGGAL